MNRNRGKVIKLRQTRKEYLGCCVQGSLATGFIGNPVCVQRYLGLYLTVSGCTLYLQILYLSRLILSLNERLTYIVVRFTGNPVCMSLLLFVPLVNDSTKRLRSFEDGGLSVNSVSNLSG